MIFKSNKIPVLMYHALTGDDDAGHHPVHISVSAFKLQMALLASKGYRSITLNEFLKGKNVHQGKKVLITFDDGYHSVYSKALPVLNRFGFTAVVFLTTGPVGDENFLKAPGILAAAPCGDRPLAWNEIVKLKESGWQIEAHSVAHFAHARLGEAALADEILGSQSALVKLGFEALSSYAFPYGSYSSKTINFLKENGFRSAFSVHPGLAKTGKGNYAINRISIVRETSLEEFKRQLRTGYKTRAQQVRSLLRSILFSFPLVRDYIMKRKR